MCTLRLSLPARDTNRAGKKNVMPGTRGRDRSPSRKNKKKMMAVGWDDNTGWARVLPRGRRSKRHAVARGRVCPRCIYRRVVHRQSSSRAPRRVFVGSRVCWIFSGKRLSCFALEDPLRASSNPKKNKNKNKSTVRSSSAPAAIVRRHPAASDISFISRSFHQFVRVCNRSGTTSTSR